MSTTEESTSPWSRPGDWQPPPAPKPAAAAPPPGAVPLPVKEGHGAGAVTRLTTPPPPIAPPAEPPADPGAADRRRLLWFGGIAAAVVAAGLAIVLGLTLGGGAKPFWERPSGPSDVRPPLARACPPPGAPPSDEPPPPAVAPATGPRTVDQRAGISYRKYPAPWEPWNTVWRQGSLQVAYGVGQHFITEEYDGGSYHASILSGSVPAAENDAMVLDLECVGRAVSNDVRNSYYPRPNTLELLRDGKTTLGGRPAWVTEFRLHFNRPGLMAKDERAAVATIDVGRPEAAILYVSIPGTHKQFDWVIDDVLASVRPT
ncbi:hypothetical protein [Rhizomonospora bruguierae]|uniref:hypothetical protein n=1 Tax=Rhizomonospora bruguierae TaxID=1581705 RepID=UPI001BCD9745|nr:hypothetical protein [Micromonospora sp. NBRC 107566]